MPGSAPFQLFAAGGWVMYPLLAVSLLSVTLCAERFFYWFWQGESRTTRAIGRLSGLARRGEWAALREAARTRSVVGKFARLLLDDGGGGHRLEAGATSEGGPSGVPDIGLADVAQAVETIRGEVERFAATLSAIITAAPMLGILGTVTGIIQSFRLLGTQGPVSDPSAVASGIAEALLTTALGLIIALVTLFPYSVFRAKADRCLGRLDAFGLGLVVRAGARLSEP
ncbi:MAG: MotA/TolQ/ExbB proton channel family protein [Planctomycetota bacterium]|nr:MotA/TolQ/ExbB proton channel family protein [Planctomycetota bacterium]